MQGSKQEVETGKWRLRVYTGQRTAKGSPVQVSRTFLGGERQAEDALTEFITETKKVQHRVAGKHSPTVTDLLEAWLAHIEPRRTPYTIKGYRSKVKARLGPAFGSVRMDRLTAYQLDQTYAAWQADGTAAATIRQCHAILAAAYAQAIKWSWVTESPTKKASPPSLSAKPMRFLTPDEMRALLTTARQDVDDPIMAAAIALAAVTGARRGELCALRWSDVDLAAGEMTIGRSLTVVAKDATEGETKTHQIRRLALDPVAVAVLRARHAEQVAQAAADMVPLCDDPFILSRASRGNMPCLPDGLTHGFYRVCVKAGFYTTLKSGHLKAWFHLHQVRHFVATTAIASGADIRTVAGRLGHADASVTLKVYAHTVAAQDQQLAGVLGAVIG